MGGALDFRKDNPTLDAAGTLVFPNNPSTIPHLFPWGNSEAMFVRNSDLASGSLNSRTDLTSCVTLSIFTQLFCVLSFIK